MRSLLIYLAILALGVILFAKLAVGLQTWTTLYDDTGDLYLSTGGIQFDVPSLLNLTKPVCDANARGLFWVEPGSSGVADAIYFCQKNSLDIYLWKVVVS